MHSTRKQFLAATGGAAATALAQAPAAARGAAARTPSAGGDVPPFRDLPGFATQKELWAQQEYLASLAPLFTGSPNHRRFVDFLEARMRSARLRTQRRTFTFDYQDFRGRALSVGGRRLRNLGFWPYSGSTGRRGVTAPLHDAGTADAPDFSGAAGKIVLIESPTGSLPLTESYAVRGIYPPDEIDAWAAYDHEDVAYAFLSVPELEAAKAAGAAGAICIWPNVSDAAADWQNTPFNGPPHDLPALWVGKDNGAFLKAGAATGAEATLTLDQPTFPGTPTDNLWAVLPGETDDVIIVNTHSDGCNATEENGMIGVVALARYFARRRNRKTLVFLMTTGHFGHGLVPGTENWIEEHPDLIERAAACVTIEHLGTTEWRDDPATGRYRPTGKNEFGWAYTPQAPTGSVFLESVGGTAAQRAMAIRPLALYFGEGNRFAPHGIPTISYITCPSYLFTSPPGGEHSKLDPDKFYGEIVTFARCVQALDAMSPASIEAFPGPAA
jgi:PA domain